MKMARNSKNLIGSASLALLLAQSVALAADWPQFRGPSYNGVSEDTGVPVKLDRKDVAWKSDLPGRGLSSPIVIGDRVFVTCCSGPKEQQLQVLCFSATDGAKLWERHFWATGRTMCQSKTCMAAPSPASDGKRIVAFFSCNDAMCLDLEGNLLWFRGLGRDYPNAGNSLGMSSSLAIAGGVVVAQVESESDAFTVGLDLETGVNKWKLERAHKSNWSSPIVVNEAGREKVILLSSKSVSAIDPDTGKVIWESTNAGGSIPSTACSGGVLFVPTKAGLAAMQSSAPGEEPKQVWQSNQLRPGYASPVVLNGKVFTISDAGIMVCGAAGTGERLWKLRLKGELTASPLAVGNYLYCVTEAGTVQVVDITKPEGEIVSELELGETILSTPANSRGAIYIRSDSHLWRIGKAATG